MKTFLERNAAEVLCGAGLVLLIVGLGMVYLPLAPIAAGIALFSVGLLMAKQSPLPTKKPE